MEEAVKAENLIKELDKLISMEGQFEFCSDFTNPHITRIKDINFWITNVFKDAPQTIASLTEFVKQNNEQAVNSTIETGIKEVIATAKALMLDLKPESIYEELNWLDISRVQSGSERLRIWRTVATLIIESSSNPNFASEVSITAKGMDEVLFMLIQVLYNIMSCAANSKMIWPDLNLNGAYLWVIEKIKSLDCDFAEKIQIKNLPERISMGEGEDIEWNVMWENHWQTEIADAISSVQKRLLDNPVPIPESHDWQTIIKQYREKADEIQKRICEHERMSEAAFKKLIDKLPQKTNSDAHESSTTIDLKSNKPIPLPDNLTQMEEIILETLGDKKMTGDQIAKKMQATCHGGFKGVLSNLGKRGILINDKPGYRRHPQYLPYQNTPPKSRP